MTSIINKNIGKYRVIKLVGKGGMGAVYQAVDETLDRSVALKMIDVHLAKDESFVKRFKTEAKALARLENPNIVTIYALEESESGMFIAMEYVEGHTLAEEIPVPLQRAVALFIQTLSAIEHAHKAGIIHRDIKPKNILITPQGKVKVTDFGLAKVKKQHGGESTVTQMTCGTLHYMSPEQVKGLGHVDYRTDIYSCGMTFYEALAGRTPFGEKDTDFTIMKSIIEKKMPPPDHFKSDIPKSLSNIIMKAIEKDPDKRYQSAREMREAFLALRKQKIPKESIKTQSQSDKRRKNLFPILIPVGVILLILLIMQIIKLAFIPRPIPPEPDVPKDTTGTAHNVTTPSDTLPLPYCNLQITSIPADADVYLDSKNKGRTPLRLSDIEAGEYWLKVSKEGYKDNMQTIVVRRGEDNSHDIRLIGLGSLSIYSRPSGASVWIDGQRHAEQTPTTVQNLSEDSYRILLKKQGYADVYKTVNIKAGQKEIVDVNLQALSGKFKILAIPYGSIYIDGRLVKNETNIWYQTDVSAGIHEIKVVHPVFGIWRDKITIKSGTTVEKIVDFQKTGKITVIASPGWGKIFVDGIYTEKQTPAQIEVKIGVHEIEVKREELGYFSEKKTIIVYEGMAEKMTFQLIQKQ